MAKYGKIAVLAGGISNEREISLKSGRAVYEALRRRIEEIELVDIKDGSIETLRNIEADIVFIALHGKFGEDGSLQAMLEELNLTYTGSGVAASRSALDKIASRGLFVKNGLKVPLYKIVRKGVNSIDAGNSFQAPFVVKPQFEGSSIGLSIVSDKTRVQTALDTALNYGDAAIIEEYIHGREFTVGILDEKSLPVVEIITRHNVYDFHAKYVDDGTRYIVPAELDKNKTEEARKIAVKAHNILGCRDFSRVDIRMDSSGNMYLLEVNTIPGLTERSLLPKAALAMGMGFEELCMKIVDMAYKRGKKKWQKRT